MIYEPKEFKLKDGRTALLRSPTAADAAALVEYLKITAEETPFLLRCPEECTMTVEQEEAYLRRSVDIADHVMILCEVDGKIAGNCNLSRMNKLKTRHRGEIGIALVRKYWNLGIGTAMFEEMLRLATEWGIAQLELEVIEGNDRAIALYEKMGFSIVAAKPNAIRLPDGSLLKEYLMIRQLQ